MYKKFLLGEEKLDFNLTIFSRTKPDYSTYGTTLNSSKASNATRGDENCITEGSGSSWMSSTW